MRRARKLAPWLGLTLISTVLASATWLAWPVVESPLEAAPAGQVPPSPTPRRAPTPTPSAEQVQIRLMEIQQQRLRQERDIDQQIWRAPAEAVASFGPTLVGIGLLYLLARALRRLLPPEPAAAEPSPDEREEEEPHPG